MKSKLSRKELSKLGNSRHFKYPYKRLFNKLKRCAERKSISVELTYEEFLTFVGSKCFYCHSDLKWIKHGKEATAYNLDRKDNNKGYSLSNCIPCCWKCNNAKSNNYSHEEWYIMNQYWRDLLDDDCDSGACPIR